MKLSTAAAGLLAITGNDDDGFCAVHEIEDGDLCDTIAMQYHLALDDLDDFNVGKTWGWMGCTRIQLGQKICVSDGDPPMPAPLDNAYCGPQIDDTPGTAENGTYSCISNCSMDIVNNDEPPGLSKSRILKGGMQRDRAWIWMSIESGNHSPIFTLPLEISEDFVPNDNGVEEQFAKFVDMKDSGLKRVISFGGWAFSNEASTNHFIREGVKPENRETFSENIVKFVEVNELDGALPEGKTIAIAAPASYWYLRNFPIHEIADVVDYIVYMSYDLHGQWDVGNEWARYAALTVDPGSDCLRSHVNITETMNSLAMVTKAGVPSHKLVIGVSSYGRSYKMAERGCTGPMCKYLDAEIAKIKKLGEREWTEKHDNLSDSTIFVYDDVEWVAYMDSDVKKSRLELYRDLNFGGTSDWPVDLQNDYSVCEKCIRG
ncbi:glycoside hydrolase superfamily [Aspergillus cavernicola]|uniref:chitinase n=1 Tax=Aspergillus cavernicola TaxID=176166 RepID=A0ABR4IQK4_9EURO